MFNTAFFGGTETSHSILGSGLGGMADFQISICFGLFFVSGAPLSAGMRCWTECSVLSFITLGG